MIWSAKSSTEGTESSGQIAAAPNCKNSYESSRREIMWIITFSRNACNTFSRKLNQLNYKDAVKSTNYRPHAQGDWYGKCRSCGATKKLLQDRKIILENKTHLFKSIDN